MDVVMMEEKYTYGLAILMVVFISLKRMFFELSFTIAVP
jgi:hypothetical protein